MKYNSTKNQEVKSKFVNREIIHNCSVMISELQGNEQFHDEIFELFFNTPNFDLMIENWQNSANNDEISEVLDTFSAENINEIDQRELCEHLDLEYQYCDPFEFWIVTGYLGEKLEENGEVIADFMGFTIWGRQTTGQAILLDYAISKVCADMEILEGQKNEW